MIRSVHMCIFNAIRSVSEFITTHKSCKRSDIRDRTSYIICRYYLIFNTRAHVIFTRLRVYSLTLVVSQPNNCITKVKFLLVVGKRKRVMHKSRPQSLLIARYHVYRAPLRNFLRSRQIRLMRHDLSL